MSEQIIALDGVHTAMFIVAVVSATLGVISVLMQAAMKLTANIGPSLAFRTAFIIVFTRIAFRQAYGGHLTYSVVCIYATPGLALVWAVFDAMRIYRKTNQEHYAHP